MKNDYSDMRASIYTGMKCTYNPVVEQPIIVDINRQVPNEIAEKFARELLSRWGKMSPLRQEKVIAGLRTENAYPHKISKIVVEETHISWIFLTGLYAYKIKKNIKFGKILDFSSLEFRKISCQKEVELNKILCGNMYKGVVKVVGKNGDNIIRITNLEHKGKPLEYAVKMREIPQQYRMDNLLLIGKLT